jgi:hypothetical protein
MAILKKIILFFLASSICSYTWVFASWIDHFEVKFEPTTVKVNESLDLTIEAMDKNNTVVTNYDWTILIFSESDPEAELPSDLKENTYTFSTEDQWKIKFENWVKFKSAGLQNIHIYDLNDDTVFWVAEATITESKTVSNIDISIIAPENGLTIWKNTIWISWTTQKNHKVKIIVNGKDEYTTTSNDEWVFEKEIENLKDWDNKFKAQVLDADSKIIWESDEVSIKIELNSLAVKNVKLTPKIVDSESNFEIEITSNPGLTKINAIIDDVLIELKETTDWVYITKNAIAPKVAGIYRIDVNLQDELGHKKTELWVASLTVNEIPLLSGSEEDKDLDLLTGSIDNIDRELKITWLKLVELKTKSILTWDAIPDVESYNVYKKNANWSLELIQNVKTPMFEVAITWDDVKYDFFAVKAVAKTNSWELYEWSLSDATKIKTGPEIIILLVLSMLIWWGYIYMKKRKNA